MLANNPSFLGVALFAVIALIVFSQKSKTSAQTNDEVVDETVADEETSETISAVETVEERKPADNPFYKLIELNLYGSLLLPDLTVRVKQNSMEKWDDTMYVYMSFPHLFNDFDRDLMRAEIPQLTEVSISGSHQLKLVKSPAVRWRSIERLILGLSFKHLHKVYAWKLEKQEVSVKKHDSDSSVLNFNLKLETKYHLDQGRRLLGINGIQNAFTSNSSTNAPACMDHNNNYDFNLGKGNAFTWEELWPKFKKVLEEYFPAGIILRGYEDAEWSPM